MDQLIDVFSGVSQHIRCTNPQQLRTLIYSCTVCYCRSGLKHSLDFYCHPKRSFSIIIPSAATAPNSYPLIVESVSLTNSARSPQVSLAGRLRNFVEKVHFSLRLFVVLRLALILAV